MDTSVGNAHVSRQLIRRQSLAALAPIAFLTLLLIYPLIALLSRGLASGTAGAVWSDPLFWKVARFTYGQALLSAVLSGVVGVWGALVYSEQRFAWRELLWRGSLVCFSLPPILVAAASLSYWRGLRLSLYGWSGILLAHVFFNYPLFLKAVGRALMEMDRAEELSALSLGASRLRCFFEITLPKILPPMAGALCLSFLYCATSFLIPLLIGGGPRFATLEVAIYEAVKIELDVAAASQMALFQLALSLCVYAVLLRCGLSAPPRARGNGIPALYRVSRRAYLLVLGFLVAGPLATLLMFGARGLKAVEWRELLGSLWITLQLAGLSGAMTVLVAFSLAYSARHTERAWLRWMLSALASLPLSISSVVLSLALLIAYPRWMSEMRGSLFTIAMIQAVGATPPVFRSLVEGFHRIPPSWYRTAVSLGAGPIRQLVFLELPAMRASLGAAFLIAVAFSMGEVGAVLMFVSEGISTLPLEIYRSIGQYEYEGADALGALLLILMTAVHLLVGWWEK